MESQEVKWYLRPWAVIVALFVVLGPLGLPLLYRSPQFSRAWKATLTLLTILYTGYLIWATTKSIEALSGSIAQFQALLG